MTNPKFLKALHERVQKEQEKIGQKIYMTFNKDNVRLYYIKNEKNITHMFVDIKTGNIYSSRDKMKSGKHNGTLF